MESWELKMMTAMREAAEKSGTYFGALEYEHCLTDQTWGDRWGLVFFGAEPAVCERAAKFFEAWARKNLYKLGVVGGYEKQSSIAFEGEFEFLRFSNGAKGWYKKRELPEWQKKSREENPPVETRAGYATSFIYYPGAD